MSVIKKAQYIIDEFIKDESLVISVCCYSERLECDIRTTKGIIAGLNGLFAHEIKKELKNG